MYQRSATWFLFDVMSMSCMHNFEGGAPSKVSGILGGGAPVVKKTLQNPKVGGGSKSNSNKVGIHNGHTRNGGELEFNGDWIVGR